jgi:nicotinate phosphoribosyltransferase
VSTSTALHTDRYELTMIDAALQDGTAHRRCLFEVFARRLPGARRYGIVAGTGRLLSLIADLRFGDRELEWLRAERVVSERTLDWLADYRFSGSIDGYREGEVYFPNSPLLTVEASFAEGVLLETLALSVLNFDSAVANAATRMVTAAAGRPLAEMGSRRANEEAAIAASRAAYIAGFGATSNLEAGLRWGIPTMGTAAHAFTLLHDSEEEAFQAQVDALGPSTTLLVDTYDVQKGVETAVRVAGTELGAVRLDSGDLPVLVSEVRQQLDALGARNTKITVTNDLDEFTIAALSPSPVDSFGVGTSLVTGSGSPAASMVYKLVARRDHDSEDWTPVAKASAGKVSRGGRKSAVRRLDAAGKASAEVVRVLGSEPRERAFETLDASERVLIVPLVTDGVADERYLGVDGTRAARAHREKAVAELPLGALRLSRGEPVLETILE